MKERIAENVYLTFTETESGKFSFSSENPSLQAWVESCKNKKVKLSAIGFVIKAAKDFLRSGVQVQAPVDKDYGSDYVSALNEYCQRNRKPAPAYEDLGANGPDHDPTFFYQVTVNGKMAEGCGSNKKEARQAAAAKLLKELNVTGISVSAPKATQPSNTNYRQELRTYCDRRRLAISYETVDYDNGFLSTCYVDGDGIGVGKAATKKAAEEEAAQSALGELKYPI